MINKVKECWNQLSSFRNKRKRCIDFTYGRQWNDIIEVDGRFITEYEYIRREGNVPLKNNLIRRIVRNVLGVFREKLIETLDSVYSGPLSDIAMENSLPELFSRSMEEFLISGMVVHRKGFGILNGKSGVWTQNVSPESFFFNTDSRDFRGNDLKMVGQVHKVDFTDWSKAFVKSPADYRKALEIFGDSGRHVKVTEVWQKEMVPEYLVHNRQNGTVKRISPEEKRRQMYSGLASKWVLSEKWRYYFITDNGTLLLSGDSPYLDGSHPFVVKCYPFLDGEIQSLVADMIDQQRYTNRLITLYDWVIRASAKGVLLMPEGAVAPGNLKNVADQWGRFNGVIVYKSDPIRPEPKQINSNLSNIGITDLLEIQLKMMEDVSGVNGILQGNTSGGNVSGALYNSQTTNAMYSLTDLLETFNSFVKECGRKDEMLLRQTIG